jgi:NADH:ubiquinone oxidoreductase subunit E/NAD-dependent dihydropyrimidine dehydrogenase PreA subunit
MDQAKIGSAVVVGGGIGGMQAALDLAEAGIKVQIVERGPSIGGVMSQLDKTFPTNDCAMCTMAPRLVEIGRHRDIEIITLAEVQSLAGEPGNFRLSVKRKPRFVDESKCTGCGLCANSCPVSYRVQPGPNGGRQKLDLAPPVKDQVAPILSRWAGKEGPLMPILQEVNAVFNYFPEDVLRYVAQETGYPLAHIYRIATFYSAFSITPRGKHTVNVCMGTTCYVRGSERLLDRFSSVIGTPVDGTTEDRLFTLKSVRCIGCCGLAPVATIGQDVFGKLAVKDVPGIVERYREPAHAQA